jgi:predicted Zn-dependent protease
VKVLNLNLALYYGKKKYYVYDKNNQLDYELEKNNKDIINVMSIFDVLVHFLPKNICSMVAIIDQDIFDPSSPDNYIVGRACGDRVCVVQYSDDKEEFYGTIIHELLHTFGFDHCYLWDCIMNENISGSMQLCLHDLEKLQLVNPFNYLQRFKDIYKISKSIGLTKECEWL